MTSISFLAKEVVNIFLSLWQHNNYKKYIQNSHTKSKIVNLFPKCIGTGVWCVMLSLVNNQGTFILKLYTYLKFFTTLKGFISVYQFVSHCITI